LSPLINLPSTIQKFAMTQHILFVCKTCATVWQDGKPQGKSGGQELLENLAQASQTWELKADFLIQAVECMSACSHSCTVSFAAPGKYTYLFGDLPAQNTASAILQCAAQYYAKPDGLLPWSERPEPLKKGVIARIPPIKSVIS
jgi:predicted metal-binding protein